MMDLAIALTALSGLICVVMCFFFAEWGRKMMVEGFSDRDGCDIAMGATIMFGCAMIAAAAFPQFLLCLAILTRGVL